MREAFGRLNNSQFEIRHKHLPFFLYPEMPADVGGGYRLPLAWGERLLAIGSNPERLGQLGATVGMQFNFQAEGSSTFDSHRLLLHAESQGLAGELRDELGQVYFIRGKRLADHVLLSEAAKKVGLDGADEILAGDAFAAEVRASVKQTARQQIHSIPVFFFSSGGFSATVHGSSSAEEFLDTFKAVERHWNAHDGTGAAAAGAQEL